MTFIQLLTELDNKMRELVNAKAAKVAALREVVAIAER